MQENKLAIFEEKEIRREWYKEDWYFFCCRCYRGFG